MRVLVTGAEGYIGTVLAPYLTASGMDVTGLDTGYYNSARLFYDPDIATMPTNPQTAYARCKGRQTGGTHIPGFHTVKQAATRLSDAGLLAPHQDSGVDAS